MKPVNEIICGDCLKVMPRLPKAKMIFADPPDNLGMKYEDFIDKWKDERCYWAWLHDVMDVGITYSDIFWFSHHHKYYPIVGVKTFQYCQGVESHKYKLFIWRFTFGQHNHKDCGNGYRPLLRIMRKDAILYPDAIRIPSARQLKYNDKRANPKGRVPDDVWDFPRVCGTFNERRKWHPNQHPEALIERIVKFSCVPGDLVIDMFAGTGTVNRVCKRLGIACIGIEVSKFYCEQIAREGCGLMEQRQ